MALEPHDLEEFDSSLSPPELQIGPREAAPPVRGTKVKRALKVVTGFLAGQGASQAIGVLASLFLVRRLSIEAYAQFGLATGFQTVFSVLMDLGFASTIVPLVGDRRDDLALVGRYVRSAKHLRDRGFWILAPVAAISFLTIMHRHHWSWTVQIMLLASVLLSLYSSGNISYFSAPLFVFGRLREYYVPQVISASGRLAAYLGLALSGGLNAWSAAGLSALNVTVNGRLIRRASHKYLKWPDRDNPVVDREMLDYILPATPAIVFSAFQSQISLFLISLFGGTTNIAEVTALSRIGQFFVVLMTFHTIVIEPYVARHSRERLLRTFAGLALIAAAACLPLVLVAFWQPQVFLWVLGTKYGGLNAVMGWYILSACINFVAGVIWIMNRARKWVFWSGSLLEVILLLGVQIGFLAWIGVRTTREAVMFGLASSVCLLIAHSYVTVHGFIHGASHKGPAAA
jgi:O-antigen/teichoic acid export membrane protein